MKKGLKKLLALALALALVMSLGAVAFAAEEETVYRAQYGIPDQYTKIKIFVGTYGFGPAELHAAMTEDESAFYIAFSCFGDDQALEGTVEDGIVKVTYDMSGFVSGDAQQMYDDTLNSEEPWLPLIEGEPPEGFPVEEGPAISFDGIYGKWVQAGLFMDSALFMGGETLAQADDPVTRGEMANILDEFLDWSWDSMAGNNVHDLMYAADGESYQSDADFYTDVLKAIGNGVLTPTEDGYIQPYGKVTLADACAIICTAFEILAGDDAVAALSAYVAEGADPTAVVTRTDLSTILDNMAADYPAIAERIEGGSTDWVDKSTVIHVCTVDTYRSMENTSVVPGAMIFEGGWIETDDTGAITTPATGTKDLDIRLWVPEGTQAGDNVPVILFTYGGSWIRGDNTGVSSFFLDYLLDHGIAVAALTYRYEQEACFPYSMYDLQAQIRYLKIHAEELGISADNMGISGESAGAYWAAQLAVSGNESELQDPGYVTFEGDQLGMLTELKYCACQYGCFNMMDTALYCDWRIKDPIAADDMHDQSYSNDPDVLGSYAAGVSPEDIRDAYENGTDDPLLQMMVQRFIDGSPIFQVDENDPEFFFYHGSQDDTCPLNQAVEMYGTMRAAGVDCVLRVCSGMGHGSPLHPQYYLEMLQWCVSEAEKF